MSSPNKQGAGNEKARVIGYLAALPPDRRRAMKALRAAIKSAAPGAVEAFSYGIPAFRVDGRILIWYAAWKAHCSMYPISAPFARRHGIDVGGYKLSKGTIQFPLTRAVPVTLVKRLVKARVTDLRKN